MDITEKLRQGLGLQKAGHLLEAAEAYRAILNRDPKNVDALNLLSTVFHVLGDQDLAVKLAGLAATNDPTFFAPYVNLGNALQASGQLDNAVAAFEKAHELNPVDAVTLSNLASALNALERFEMAEEKAFAAIDIAPELAEAHNNFGNALAGQGRYEEALIAYDAALKINIQFAEAHFNKGRSFAAMGDPAKAQTAYKIAVKLDPKSAIKQMALGDAFMALDAPQKAEKVYERVLELDPGSMDARCNLAVACQNQGRLDEAEALLRGVLAEEPDAADVHWNLALVLLQKGLFIEGWREYEWRWDNPKLPSFKRRFEEPLWDGEALEGRTILLHAEQGFGDSIQFVRYAPMVAARGGRVLLECRPAIRSVLGTAEGIEAVYAQGDDLPPFDVQAPLMSLPCIFVTTVETIPAEIPYLKAPSDGALDTRLTEVDGLKVGFVWAGSPTYTNDSNRSCPLDMFGRLFDLDGVTFFSLQRGPAEKELEVRTLPDNVIDLRPDFADIAKALEVLDVVVTVDTAVAHLAGAMGRPVWVVLPYQRAYTWIEGREDNPWYPAMRTFRQTAKGDWDDVFTRVRDALEELKSRQGA